MTERRMLSIDPGEVHVGTALWLGDECYETKEYTPGEFFPVLEKWLRAGSLDVVVVESFVLYPWKSKEQGFSQLLTVEVIGVIRYLVARWGRGGVPLIEQPALIKKPTDGQLRGRGLTNRAVDEGKGGHCKDAVTHGFYYVMYNSKRLEAIEQGEKK